jgi:molybdopterin converting factor small subunit
MVKVMVKFMSIARQRAETGTVEFTSGSVRLRDVLREIVEAYKLVDIILDTDGGVRRWARVLVNGRSEQYVGGLNMVLHDGDRIALIYPYAENF